MLDIFKRKFFIFQNLNLSYLDSETQSEQIILITHANGYSAECYSYLIESLRDKYRVIALDFAGFKDSEKRLKEEIVIDENYLYSEHMLMKLNRTHAEIFKNVI